MAKSYKTFTKAKLLSILSQKCANALAMLPPPDTFEFLLKRRDGEDTFALMVGNYATKENHTEKNKLYLEGYDTSSQATGGEASSPRPGEVRLVNGTRTTSPSFIEGPFTYTSHYGKATITVYRM
ncbi:hypothetical protein N0V83_006475 [Neocucurbitaria cava]|uniref:Uncharacterized protein n=1 Tax=Neocucurbitaria cava TaxID=798079 RepID=A0A9W8Y640_9PLEO|nr:hypothetical protein N0V83_006475 [Neocucurbitaria cava]